MKHTLKLLSIALLISGFGVAQAAVEVGRSYFAGRSQAVDTARELVCSAGKMHKSDMDKVYGNFKVTFQYGQNFDRDEIGKYLFFRSAGSNTMSFGGKFSTTAADFASQDVYSPNFLLPAGFQSDVTIKPKVQNFVVDFDLFVGLDEWLEGLYFQVHAPLVHNKVDLQLTSTGAASTSDAGYYANTNAGDTPQLDTDAVNVASLNRTVADAWKGQTVAGDVVTAWKYGRIDGKQDDTKLGDVEATLGYNFVNKESCNLCVGVRATFPAGGKSKAVYVLEPTVGNGGHFGLGAHVHGMAQLWEKDEDQNLRVHLNASVGHLFKASVLRSYDWTTNGVGSRYLMMKKFTTLGSASTIAENSINVSTLKAKVAVDVQYDASLMLSYQYENIGVDLGYNVWGRSKEDWKEWDEAAIENYYGFTNWDMSTTNGTKLLADVQVSGKYTAIAVVAAAGNVVALKDINTASGTAPKALSHGLFGNLNYSWNDSEWVPSLGAGGRVEFSGDDNRAYDQWGVWVTGSVSF